MTSGDRIGMVLSGGGARGAYEAGVLQWILEDRARQGKDLRVRAICGTSVGAIHAAALASLLHDPADAARRIGDVWNHLRMADILSFSPAQILRLYRVAVGGAHPAGLFDSRALRRMVEGAVPWDGIAWNLREGRLHALTVTATHVASGRPAIFVQGRGPAPELGKRAVVRPVTIGPDHVLASAAIPIVFPVVAVDSELYCDGGLRMNTPMDPAIRLGADRLFVVALNTSREDQGVPALGPGRQPGAAFLGGKVLNALLLDHVAYDLAHLDRINRILTESLAACGPDFLSRFGPGQEPRVVERLVVQPSEDLGVVASEMLSRTRWPIGRGTLGRLVLKLLEIGEGTGSDLASYLLFDSHYARRLLALGKKDAAARGDEIRDFFGD